MQGDGSGVVRLRGQCPHPTPAEPGKLLLSKGTESTEVSSSVSFIKLNHFISWRTGNRPDILFTNIQRAKYLRMGAMRS